MELFDTGAPPTDSRALPQPFKVVAAVDDEEILDASDDIERLLDRSDELDLSPACQELLIALDEAIITYRH